MEVDGLWQMPYRDYDPSLGRWLNQDPIGWEGGPNFYGYVNGRPIVADDPLGLVATDYSPPTIIYTPYQNIPTRPGRPLCGRTMAGMNLGGSCNCVNGSYAASLTITYRPTIYVANNVKTPPDRILEHEMKHHGDNLRVLNQARVAGELIEKKSVQSQGACEAAIDRWKYQWYSQVYKAASSRDFWSGFGALIGGGCKF